MSNDSTALIDASSTITLGGAAQVALAADFNKRRGSFLFYNLSDITLYISFVGTATTDSLPVLPGGTEYFCSPQCPYQAVSVLGATTGKKYLLWYS